MNKLNMGYNNLLPNSFTKKILLLTLILSTVISICNFPKNFNASSEVLSVNHSSISYTNLYRVETPRSVYSKNYFIESTLEEKTILTNAIKNDVSTFHLFSHGRSGELFINRQWLNASEITSLVSQKLKTNSYQPTTKNIYSCNFF